MQNDQNKTPPVDWTALVVLCVFPLGIWGVMIYLVGNLPDRPGPKVTALEEKTHSRTTETQNLTEKQVRAARLAQSYLTFGGFSRAGLIDQLSLRDANGFSHHDATSAVESLPVDWNLQAVRAANWHVRMSEFTCDQLIDQLSSEHGDKFSRSQASYGARQSDAC